MALNWCFNEPWPNAAGSGNLVTWYNTPMPVLFEVGKALRPALASARIRTLKWRVGEVFNAELWILSDAPTGLPAGRVEAWLQMEAGREIFLLEWRYPDLPPNTNLQGPIAQIVLPAADVKRFALLLKVPEHPEMDSTYPLVLAK